MKSASLRNLTNALFSRVQRTAPAADSAKATPADIYSFYRKDTAEIWFMLGIGLTALSAYLITLAPGVYPGASAVAMGKALGLLPAAPVTAPLWLLFSKGVAALPVFDALQRLNLFSAICGSLAAAWLFRITKRVIFELIREAPSIRLVPVGDEETVRVNAPTPALASVKQTTEPDSDVLEHRFATFGGVIASASFAFCTPFWIASTSLHAQPFTLLLLLLAADAMACYHFTGKTTACVIAVFLLGLGSVESVAFVTLAPLGIALVLLASIRYDQISESFLLLMLAAGLSGLAANLLLFIQLSLGGQAFSADLAFRMLSGLVNSHANSFLNGLPKAGWLFVVIQTVAPLLIVSTSLKLFSAYQDDVNRWKWRICNVLFTAFSVACLLGFPKTAWPLMREGGQLPIIPCLAVAIASGLLFAYWCLKTSTPVYNESYELVPPSLGVRMLGYGMCGLLAAVTVAAVHTNLPDADGKKSAFADRIADSLLSQAGSARCLLTDGNLDLNLLIRSHLAGKKITLLPCRPESKPATSGQSDKPAPFRLSLPGTETAPSPSAEAFVVRWLHENPKEQGQVAVVGKPEVWQRAGLLPVPNGLLYVGTDMQSLLDGSTLLARNQEAWKSLVPLLADDPTLLPELHLLQARLRAHASRMANDLGVLLERRGDLREAEASYGEALHLDKDNLCANLNLFGLRLKSRVPGTPQAFVSHAASLASHPGVLDAFDTLTARYGMLSPQEADTLLPAVMLDYGLGSKPPAVTFLLLEKWLGACYSPPPEKQSGLAIADRSSGEVPDAMLSQALSLLLKGQSEKAEKLLRLIVFSRPSTLSAWALLAEVLMSRGELKEVRDVVIPAMRAVPAKDTRSLADSTLADMTQGCLLMRTSPANPAGARACFARALSANPKLVSACDELLRTDALLGDASQLEADALRIVGNIPGHPAANAILGSFRLGQKRLSDAERFLRQSLQAKLSAGTLNDLAELLRQQKKFAEAEQQARLAVRIAPTFYQAWDTLCNVLIEQDRLNDANGPLRCALALSADDPRLYLTLTRLRIKEGNIREATRILDSSKLLLSKTSPAVRDEHSRLVRSLQTQK